MSRSAPPLRQPRLLFHQSPVTSHQSRVTSHESPVTVLKPPVTPLRATRFPPHPSRRIVALRMVSYDSGGASPETPSPGFFARTLFNTDHKVIGLRYLWLALGSVLLGMLLSLLMRIHLVWPGCANSVPLWIRQHAGALRRPDHVSRFADGFSGAHHGAASRLWQLFSCLCKLARAKWRFQS